MRGMEVHRGGVLVMGVLMGFDLASLVDIKLACNSWPARFSFKFLISQTQILCIVPWTQTSLT